jgi:hypothetical protein
MCFFVFVDQIFCALLIFCTIFLFANASGDPAIPDAAAGFALVEVAEAVDPDAVPLPTSNVCCASLD